VLRLTSTATSVEHSVIYRVENVCNAEVYERLVQLRTFLPLGTFRDSD
jgi:hypothetical protein